MKDISVIIVAAGESRRLKAKVRKPYLMLKGRPILCHSIYVFRNIPAVREIVIAVNPKDIKMAQQIIRGLKDIKIVLGGARRADSVFNALMATDEHSRLVLVHDAARPFVSRLDVLNLIKEVRQAGAAILAVPVKDTIKKARMTHSLRSMQANDGLRRDRDSEWQIVETITPRESLWAAQTPQGFRRDWLIKAYQSARAEVTDDASLVEMAGRSVRIVRGSEANIKITTVSDIRRK